MIEIIDGREIATLGVSYDVDEAEAVIFALKLYADQLAAGNIVSLDVPFVADVIELTRGLQSEIASGLTTVSAPIHQAISEIYLPYLARMHESLPTTMYQGVCDTLGVRPFELFSNAITSRRMLSGDNSALQIM